MTYKDFFCDSKGIRNSTGEAMKNSYSILFLIGYAAMLEEGDTFTHGYFSLTDYGPTTSQLHKLLREIQAVPMVDIPNPVSSVELALVDAKADLLTSIDIIEGRTPIAKNPDAAPSFGHKSFMVDNAAKHHLGRAWEIMQRCMIIVGLEVVNEPQWPVCELDGQATRAQLYDFCKWIREYEYVDESSYAATFQIIDGLIKIFINRVDVSF